MQLKIPGETALISLAVHEFADIFVIFVNKFSADGCFLGTRARSYMTVIVLLRNLTYIKNYKNSVI